MKINMRKKVLSLAIASAIGVAGVMSLPAHAVNVSQNNVGEVLLFPYYTVKNGFDTIFTVTNTSDRTVVAKVRWREALNSREVRDFNVILSPHDVWTAGVTVDTAGTGALVRTFDKTCTSPALPASADAAMAALGAKEVAFTAAGYDGSVAALPTDKGGTGIGRVQEGYFEVINMGEFAAGNETASGNEVAYGALHVNGTPRNCGYVANSVLADYDGTNAVALGQPNNSLKGAVSFINVAAGQAIDATPTALENWASVSVWALPSDLNPDLNDGDAGLTANFLNDGAAVAYGPVAASADAVSVLLSATSIINEYVADGTGSFTDWVVTFPTKHHYTDLVSPAVVDPFTQNFRTNGKSCDTYTLTLYNREEGSVTPSGNAFSPLPTGGSAELCYESNVLSFNGSNVFGTGTNHVSVDTTSVGTAGWAQLNLNQANGVVGGGAAFAGSNGLPTIGFAAINRVRTAVAGNYGSTVAPAYLRN